MKETELTKILNEDSLAKLQGENSPHADRIQERQLEPGELGCQHGGLIVELDGKPVMLYPYFPLLK